MTCKQMGGPCDRARTGWSERPLVVELSEHAAANVQPGQALRTAEKPCGLHGPGMNPAYRIPVSRDSSSHT